jgi:hypothetical protein
MAQFEPQNGSSMTHLGIRALALIHTIALLLRTSPAEAFAKGGGRQPGGADHPERGDVPGWVMITLMSAVLVGALLALAGPALEGLFNQAMDKVGN